MPNENKQITDTKINGVHWGVFFHSTGNPAFSAEKIQRLVAVFEGPIVDGGSSLLSWKELSWTLSVPSNTRLYLFFRASASTTGIEETPWNGPHLNGSKDIDDQTERYLQICAVLYSDGSSVTETLDTPVLSSVRMSSYVSSAAQKFYTKTFNTGFKPKHILLTYNGTIQEGSLVQFAISGEDSVNDDDYQLVEPGKVIELDEISSLSENIKVLLRATGSTEIPFVVDEFAAAFSGDQDTIIL